MLNRKIPSALALILVVGTLTTAFAAEAKSLSFEPAAPDTHMTLHLGENTAISMDGRLDFTVAEMDGGMAVALTDEGYQTFALTGDEVVGSTLVDFNSTVAFQPAEDVGITALPLGENRSIDNSGRIAFSEACNSGCETINPAN